ncbi:ABC transporter ATP-binding protein [Halalkalibacter nanhaiisediminis]|uniref:Peptide/nickel transport system ATP-binding protein/oligopeptide transport system ATP-binding protein n=1 Tax=Halalkalibacter nanhaiisediminis TaxID=688079 RepID=A0A562QN81_9BACI|nr:dipeptide ABC transporter ATP-binding protein [Halalkalibacter nanhaiisediminis]TWI58199.1 peptide/nickel transport system ATP-binding protein/oligopeptide transport system ATP-binding protein [Halalkalibacter nanhaiisediminis]
MAQQMHERENTLLEIKGLKKFFPVKNPIGITEAFVKAVNDVSFHLVEGETYGLVGESGCGKSTMGRTVLRLIEASEGEVLYKGTDIFQLNSKELRKLRQDLQMVFQDPFSSLNPRKRIGDIIEEPMIIHKLGTKKERIDRVMDILQKVGLQPEQYYRYPHEFSGGQRQRIGLARALVVNPKLIICDEPVSALDVSIQSQIINLLQELQDEYKLTYLFIAHDLSVVRHISDRIGVMYLGKMVEEAPTDKLFSNPLHPYTQALLSAVPHPNPEMKQERVKLRGEIPSPMNPPSGCVFHTRCPFVIDACRKVVPKTKEISEGHFVACHLHD